MRKILLLLPIIIAGCVAQPTCINIPKKGCQDINAGNVGGTTLGHSNDEDNIPKVAATPR